MKSWFNTPERLLNLEVIATSWRGTPFMGNAAIKGAGVSCQKLVASIYEECGFLPFAFEADDGPMCWSRSQTESLIEKFMEKQSDFIALNWPADGRESHPRPGDMLGFKVDGCIHHCGVMLGCGRFVHCWLKNGVMFSNLHDATYMRRLAKIWRPIERV